MCGWDTQNFTGWHLPPRRANGLDEVAVDAVMFFSYWSGILALRLMQLA